ncbi:MAG: hypothetical protein HKM24_02705 [Gammaproteobacteria bacterium]|nr:hypothetical protein [Gammaproteobacteria bacterium]
MQALKLAVQSSDYLIAHLQLDAAASILERYLLFHSPHAAILNRLGQVRLLQGKPDEAAMLLKQALMLKESEDHPLAKASPLIAQDQVAETTSDLIDGDTDLTPTIG